METLEQRSATMRAVKSRDTGPEVLVRRVLWPIARGYRINYGGAYGRPDIAFPARKLAIFVHGCFWHGHRCRRGARVPSRIPPIGPPRLTATEPAIEGREERCALEGGAFSSFGNAN